jgi:hypothetical protein
MRALQDLLAHEHNADLAVIAPHDTTAAAQQQRELVGDLLSSVTVSLAPLSKMSHMMQLNGDKAPSRSI